MDFYFGKKGCVPISLGFGCGMAEFIAFCGKKDTIFYERQVFDWLGTNMWAIAELTENNFLDFLNPECFAQRKRFTYKKEIWPTNTKYDIVFIHDFKLVKFLKEFPAFKERYERRVQRYLSLLGENKELLFLRIESDGTNSIHTPESQDRCADELNSLHKFSTILKNKGTKYSIVYLTYTHPTHWDPERRICFVQFKHFDYSIRFTLQKIEQIIASNLEFIKASIK